MLPITKTINVDDPELTMDIVCFDFPSQLLALSQDKMKMQQENLVIDIDNVTRKHQNPSGLSQESLDGFACQKACDNVKANHHGNDPLLFVPICAWGDATHIDQQSEFKLEPWSFSPLTFTEKARRNHEFWGTLGCINNLRFSMAQKHLHRSGTADRIYHQQIQTILESFKSSQMQLNGVNIPIGQNCLSLLTLFVHFCT